MGTKNKLQITSLNTKNLKEQRINGFAYIKQAGFRVDNAFWAHTNWNKYCITLNFIVRNYKGFFLTYRKQFL
jgi:hypothetical protein